MACGSSRSASTSPPRWPPRSSPTSGRRWSRSSVRAATRCGPIPPASPPGTGARRRSSSTCARPAGADALRDLVDEADLLRREPAAGCAGPARAGAGHVAGRATAAGHLFHHRLGFRRAVARRAGLGAARARPGRRATGTVHRGRSDVAPLPRGQRVGGAGRRPRRRGRVDQARLDRLRPTRRDLAPRCAPVPERRGDLPPRGTPAPHCAPDQVADPARLRHGRRPRRHGEHQRHGALARAVPRCWAWTTAGSTTRPRRACRSSPTASGTGPCSPRVIEGFGSRTADEWETALLDQPAAVAKCNSLAEWLASEQARVDHLVADVDDPVLGRVPLVGPPVRIAVGPGERRPGRRHGGEQGALGGHRIVDLSSFWAGPLASRLLAELGADVVKVEPPGGEGGFQMMPVLPNIYVDANRSKRGIVLDLKTPEDRVRLLDLVAASDVVVENAMAGAWERLGLGRGRAAGGQSCARVRAGQGLRGGGAVGQPPFLRLRRAGGDRHGDDAGRRGAAGAGQLHGQRLRDGAVAGGGDRAGLVGTGSWRGGDGGGRVAWR